MNNIHIAYQQKHHNFAQSRIQDIEKQQPNQPINTLLYKYARTKDVDEDQESLINKKPIVPHGNSLNYSQLINNIKINKNSNQQIERQQRPNEVKHQRKVNDNEQSYEGIKSDIQFNSNFAYVPKSLPKIVKNKHHYNYVQPPKYIINTSFDHRRQPQQKSGFSQGLKQLRLEKHKNKSFSISHYDIFINEGKKAGIITTAVQREHIRNDYSSEHLQNNSSLVHSFSSKVEEEQGKIKINFQNQLEKDMPQLKQTIFEASQSHLGKKEGNYVIAEEVSGHPNALQKSDANFSPQNNSNFHKKAQNQDKKSKHSPHNNSIKAEQDFLNLNYSKIQQKPSHNNQNEYIAEQFREENIEQKKHYRQQMQIFNNSFKQKNRTNRIIKQSQSAQQMHYKESNEVHKQINFHESESQELILQMNRQNNQKSIIDKYNNKHQQAEEPRYQQNKASSFKIQLEPIDPKYKVNKQGHQSQQQKPGYDQRDNFGKRQMNIGLHNQKMKRNDQNNEEKREEMSLLQYKKFDVENYMKVYEILKNIQNNLKLAQIDMHSIIKGIKNYLEIIAGGNIDNFQGYDIPLNRLKIIKNALLYERIAMVILSFAFAIGKIKQCLKYIINLTIYTTNNTLIILKILQSSEINIENKNPIMAKSDRLILKRNFDTVRNNNDVILDSIFKISKNEEAFNESFKEILKGIGKSSIEQTFYNVLEYFAFFLCISNLYKSMPFLAVAPNPYLRQSFQKKPTLIVDIIQVFCHGTRKSKSHVFRPHTQHFLHEMAQYYEIISFTCAYPNQIDKVIDILDVRKSIKHRLYRHHAVARNNYLFKDTQRIGRDLTKLILLDADNNIQNEEVNNTIYIPNWKGNKSDTTLAELCPILAAIAIKNLDCKEATKKIHEQRLKNEHQGIKYINFGLNLE